MAFTIPNLIQDRDGNNKEVALHKHCQNTILSSYGPNGEGMTWNYLVNGTSLSNLNSLLSEGDWTSKFMGNTECITQDLRSILELVDSLTDKVNNGKSFSVTFNDNNGNQIDRKTINLQSDVDRNYLFSGFGRNLKLKIGEEYIKFNTMSSQYKDQDGGDYEDEVLEIEVPGQNLRPGSFIQVEDEEIRLDNQIPPGYNGAIGVNNGKIVPSPFIGIGSKSTKQSFIDYQSTQISAGLNTFPSNFFWDNNNATSDSYSWNSDDFLIEHDGILKIMIDTAISSDNTSHQMNSIILEMKTGENENVSYVSLSTIDIDVPGNKQTQFIPILSGTTIRLRSSAGQYNDFKQITLDLFYNDFSTT